MRVSLARNLAVTLFAACLCSIPMSVFAQASSTDSIIDSVQPVKELHDEFELLRRRTERIY